MPSQKKIRSTGTKNVGISYPSSLEETGPRQGVRESAPGAGNSRKIETLLSDIVTRLDRIEEKIDESSYPPESAIKPEYIRKIKKIQAKPAKARKKTYDSMDGFIQALKQ
jgi:hypothetical protein